MNNKEFDNIIKKKLESLDTQGNEGAWDLFKEKWDNSNPDDRSESEIVDQDKALDEKIKRDMQGLRIPFNSQHWIKLKEQLELEALFKKKLFVAKSVELLILAFLVLGVLNIWPIQKDIYQIPVYDIPMVASIPVNKESAEKFDAQERSKTKKQKQFLESSTAAVSRTLMSFETLPLITYYKDSEKKGVELHQKISQGGKYTPIQSINDSKIIFPFLESKSQNAENGIKGNEEDEEMMLTPIAMLSDHDLELIDIPLRPTGYPDIVLNNSLKQKAEKTFLTFALGPKVNLINSPFDPVYGFDPYNTINTNFNITAKLAKEVGPLELYTGLGYTNTSYIPRVVDEIYEPKESQFNVASLENIKFKTFNVPLGVKYNYVDTKSLQLYVAGGVDLNIIADSEYVIQDVPLGRSQPAGPPPPSNFVNEKAKLSQKEFNKGILSGGSLKDNLYASASFGLGMNVNLSSHTGIFIEPRYSHFISSKGIGPNEDKVHGLSIDLGVRYQLN